MSDITKQYEIRSICPNDNNVQIVAISGDQTVDVDFARISERDVRMLESLRGRGAMISVSIEGIPASKEEPKKWRWHEVNNVTRVLRLGDDRIPFSSVELDPDACNVLRSIGWQVSYFAKKEDAFANAERRLRNSAYWHEGDEIEPYCETIPSLKEWLSERGIRLDNGIVKSSEIGMRISDVSGCLSAITAYFEKYPDAEPELRREWGK